MCLKKIISGGQTGIDQIGLELAQKYRFETGGYAPKGFLTENGNDILLQTKFNLVEIDSDSYSVRTRLNVCNSDGTVIFGNKNSPGTKLTLTSTAKYKKPVCLNPTTSKELLDFITSNNIIILNVAGTRGSRLPYELRSQAITILSEVFLQFHG